MLKKPYIEYIDGIRAFAVLAVIIYHFNSSFLKSGFLGVDIFFLISGYVITYSLWGREANNFFQFFIKFFTKRIKKLLPTLLIYLLIISFLICFFIEDSSNYIRTGFFSLFGLSNLYLARNSIDYFAQTSDFNPFTQTWSLAIETQFYIIYPLIIWFTGFAKKSSFGIKNLTISLIFLSSLSFTCFLLNFSQSSNEAYFLLQYRFWEIGTGCLLFIFSRKSNFLLEKVKVIPSSLTLSLIILVMFLPKESGILSIPITIILSSILLISLERGGFVFQLFNNHSFNYFGKISYPLYLWHWGILSISLWTIGINWWSIPLQILIIFSLSIFSYEFIEKPIKNKTLISSKYLSLSIGSLSFLITSLILIFLDSLDNNFLFLGDKSRINNYSENKLWNRNLCSNSSNLFKKTQNYFIFNECWINTKDKKNTLNNKNIKTIFLYGNSFNEQIAPIPAYIVKKRNDIRFNSFFTNTGCIPSQRLTPKNQTDVSCKKIFFEYLKFFQNNSKEGDSFIISHSIIFPKDEKNFYINENIEITNKEALSIYIEELKNISIELKRNKKNLIVISPIPALKIKPRICSHWYSRTNNLCKSSGIFNEYANNITVELLKEYKELDKFGIIYLDIYNEILNFLNNDKYNGYKFYYDNSHLSRDGSMKLINYFEKGVLEK